MALGIGLGLTGPGAAPTPAWKKIKKLFGAAVAGQWLSNSAAFNGTSDQVDILASLPGGLNLNEYTLVFRKKMTSAVWADGAIRFDLLILADGNNYLGISKQADGTQIFMEIAGGAFNGTSIPDITSDKLITYGVTRSRSNNRYITYVQGSQIMATVAGMGLFAGAPAAAVIGNNPYTNQFAKGTLQDVTLFNRELTPAEMRQVAAVYGASELLSVLGDSITASLTNTWVLETALEYSGGNRITLANHAVGGQSITAHFSAQRLAAASDAAAYVIDELGVNDTETGDMAALYAVLDAQLAQQKADHPAARIYYLNILPRWTARPGVVVVDMPNVRGVIAAACAHNGIECWDTSDWIVGTDSADGTHVTPSGDVKIAAKVVARLEQGPEAYQAPDYGNAGGMGDRQAAITATTSLTGGDIHPAALVDGITDVDYPMFYFDTSSNPLVGKYIRFQFGDKVLISEAKFIGNVNFPLLAGTWQWQGSNNGTHWTNLGSAFTMPAGVDSDLGTSKTYTLAQMAGNVIGYKFYQLVGVSGNLTGLVVPREFQFKIGQKL